jgi:hypothetical protein
VHAGVGPARHRQRGRLPPHPLERLLEYALHGPEARLPRPAGEVPAVVLEQEAGGQDYPRLRATTSV